MPKSALIATLRAARRRRFDAAKRLDYGDLGRGLEAGRR